VKKFIEHYESTIQGSTGRGTGEAIKKNTKTKKVAPKPRGRTRKKSTTKKKARPRQTAKKKTGR
jgi:hypothetical protein